VEEYFPKQGVKIPLIIWDGIRNGNTHLFMPNVIKVYNTFVTFTFVVSTNSLRLTSASKSGNEINIRFNGIEFSRIFKRAVEKYRSDLDRDHKLQDNFINAWESIDNTPHKLTRDKRKIPKEVNTLNTRLQFSNRVNIFSDAHNGLLISKHYQGNAHELTHLLRLILRTL